ncbi:hypothetical protein AU074_09410 [Pseudomonas sp. ATCC PTA-122608]|nr:hypothetical protein AU074_09410 [Pseudomonas sp. ATCC PTA-122608]
MGIWTPHFAKCSQGGGLLLAFAIVCYRSVYNSHEELLVAVFSQSRQAGNGQKQPIAPEPISLLDENAVQTMCTFSLNA